ncbi:WD40 repeat-like protein [Atractiella rhizophila]|nr:WD40 repeat-like protein [Atractiella rhizophila]
MACTNGAIVVWQLQPSGVVLYQVKFEHTKAINKVVFGGEQGHWLISGSQDGYLKLWDIREGRPSRMILNSLSDPVRDLALSPVPGEVYAIASVHDSGSLVRWDLRKPGMNYSSIAHLGSGLCVDWTHGYDEETKSWVDWVASGGQDRKIKIWNATLFDRPKPLQTLKTTHPVRRLSFRPSHVREIASIGISSIFTETSSSLSFQSPIVDVWDISNSSIPKYSLYSSAGSSSQASALLWADQDTIWTTSRSESCLVQHDLINEGTYCADEVQRVTAALNANGDEYVFAKAEVVDEERGKKATKEEPSTASKVTGRRPKFFVDVPEQIGCAVTNLDGEREVFNSLAKNYSFDGTFSFIDTCTRNLEVAKMAGRMEAELRKMEKLDDSRSKEERGAALGLVSSETSVSQLNRLLADFKMGQPNFSTVFGEN